MSSLLALGCSHTAGVGVEPNEIYANLVAAELGLEMVNLAVSGSNHSEVESNLAQYLYSHTPAVVILQWPTPYRITTWQHGKKRLETAANAGAIFRAMTVLGPENFQEPWLRSIVVCNSLCRAHGIPAVNILLETADQYIHQRLAQFGIVLHQDDKLPGRTWFFDSAGSDGVHHSASCHRAWAQRILSLINENTTR